MTALPSLAATLDGFSTRLLHSGASVLAMLDGSSPLDSPVFLATTGAAALLERHPHHRSHAAATTLLRSPTLAETLSRALPPADVASRPVVSPAMSHTEKAALLQETVELGALYDWASPALQEALDEYLASQTDALMADGDAHTDLHELLGLLGDLAPFDGLEHPVGRLLGFAFAATLDLGLSPSPDEAVETMKDALDSALGRRADEPAPPARASRSAWLDWIETRLAQIGSLVQVVRPSRGLALAASDDSEWQYLTLTSEAAPEDEEVNLIVAGATVRLDWLGPENDPPTRASIGTVTLPGPPTPRQRPDGVLRVTWPLEGEAPAEGSAIVITFASGRTRTFRLGS